MSIVYREGLGRPLTWQELDGNFREVEGITQSTADDIKRAVAADVTAAQNAASDAQSSANQAAASAGVVGPQVSESLRRSYAEAGFNLVSGSFELGGVLVKPNDALLQSTTGKAFTGVGPFPQNVNSGSDPSEPGFSDVSGKVSVEVLPALYGIVGDGISDDTDAFILMDSKLKPLDSVDMSGITVRLTRNITMKSELVCFRGGSIYLDDCYLTMSGKNNQDFKTVLFKGNQKLFRSDFTGRLLGEFDAEPPMSNNGDAYFDRTLNRALIKKDGIFRNIYGPSGVIISTKGGVNTDKQSFDSCRFQMLDCGVYRNSDSDSQDLLAFNGSNRFEKCGAGLHLDDFKRVFMNSNTHIQDCAVGMVLSTDDYHGLGLNLQGAYINGNIYGIRQRGSMYDSSITDNIIDHNRYLSVLGGDLNIGCGAEFIVPSGKSIRQLVFCGNNARTNGDYSFKFIVDGTLEYSVISGNASWNDSVDNLLIDYSKGSAASNIIESNRFIDGTKIIDNGTPWEVNNGIFDAYNGGSIRGYVSLRTGIQLFPLNNTYYNSNIGNMFYLKDASGKCDGLYVNQENSQNGLRYRPVQVAQYFTKANLLALPQGSYPEGYMVLVSDVGSNGRPVTKGTGGKWVFSDGTVVA
ncbi:MAG: hypothetical protein ACRC8W_12355 [Plesiomonas shigelloides]